MVETVQDPRSMPEKEKKEGYERLCGGKPDAVSILARTVRASGTVQRMKTGGYGPENNDFHGNIGGSHAGVIAARELKKYFAEVMIVTNSRIDARDGRPEEKLAEVARDELTRAHVPADQIVVQDRSFSTLSELLENIRLAVENKWQHVVILAAAHQVERATAMLDRIDTVADLAKYRERPEIKEALEKFAALKEAGALKITILASEDVVEGMSRRHQKVVAAAKASPAWRQTEERDSKAAQEIKDGTYGKKSPSTSIKK